MLDVRSSDVIQVVPVTFPSGTASLRGTLFLPAGDVRAALVLNGATGVPHRFYKAFAHWLARAHQIACLTYDYRGVASSREDDISQCDATMSDWALVDQPAARAEMRRHCPGVPLWVLGHSVGGMLVPMQTGIDDIAGAITVACGYARFTEHPWPYSALAPVFWFGHAPVLVALKGYLPGRLSGFGEDLPAPVYWEWRKWCISRRFFWDDVGDTLPLPEWHRTGGAPVRIVAIEDDTLMKPEHAWRLERAYGAEHCSRVTIAPAEFGLTEIGHINAFAMQSEAIWPTLIGDLAIK